MLLAYVDSLFVYGDSYAASIRCSCLNFITSGLYGNLFGTFRYFGKKTTYVDGVNKTW